MGPIPSEISLNLLGEPILSALVDLLSIGTGPDAWSLSGSYDSISAHRPG